MINTLKRGKTGGPARGQTSAGNTGRGLAEISDRKHLTSREVERLMEATKGSRNDVRDRCLLLLMFRHGLRVSEACRMKLDEVDTESRVLHVARLKGGLSTTQPLRGDELRAVSAWLKERARMKPTGKAFFASEQRKPLHRSTVNLLLRKYSAAASLLSIRKLFASDRGLFANGGKSIMMGTHCLHCQTASGNSIRQFRQRHR